MSRDAETGSLAIGAQAYCTDGPCGHVTQAVIDPTEGTVTHVIVEPEHRQALGRLVPAEAVKSSDLDRVELRCTRAEFGRFPCAEELQFLDGIAGYPGYEPEDLLLWPFFGGNSTVPVVSDTLPVGDVAVRRGEDVRASDGPIGRVEGLVVTEPGHRISHFVLQEGHLFGHKDVCVPILAVRSVDDEGITLRISKKDVADLPAVRFRRPGRDL